MNLAKQGLCRLLVLSVTCLSIHSARAEMIATEQAVTYLSRAEVASQLYSLGVERAFAEQRVAAMSDEEIAGLQAGGEGGSAPLHRFHPHGMGILELEVPRDAPGERQVRARDAEISAPHPAVAEKLHDHPLHAVDRRGKADSLRTRNDRRVHADYFAARVHERAAGIPRVERGIRLQHVVDQAPGLGAQAAAKRAHDAGSDRVLEAVRIADRDRELSNPKAARRAKHYAGQRIRADADHGDVGIRIFT